MATPRRRTHLSILADQEQSQSQSFRFTPRGPLSRAPRPWDRKPSAPLNPRSRNREVWKKVLFAKGGDDDNRGGRRRFGEKEERKAERGVKRMRVERENGFATTKWEAGGERSRKLRMDAVARDEMNDDGNDDVQGQETYAETDIELKQMESRSISDGTKANEWHHDTDLAYHDTETEHAVNETKIPDTQTRPTHCDRAEQMFSVTLPPSLTQDRNTPTTQTITDSTFLSSSPSSRHRYHGLEGDIADVLSDFLSKAKAKRAANSAALKSENTETLFNSSNSSNSKSQGEDEDRKKPLIRLHRVSGAPKRRALDILDKNTPSPARSPLRYDRAMSSPVSEAAVSGPKVTILKVMTTAADERAKEDEMDQDSEDEAKGTEHEDEPNDGGVEGNDENEKEGEAEAAESSEQLATPPRRRTRSSKKPTPPRVRTINLRRPTGNEFVFQPRTDAQQLALSTKSNTRKNKGKSRPVQAFLKEQAQQKDKEMNLDIEDAGNNDKSESSDTTTRKEKKSVHFNDDHLVTFFEEPEQKLLSLDDISTPSRRLRKRTLPLDEEADSGDDRKAPLPLFSPSVPRKVRRLGPAKKKLKKKGAVVSS